MTDNRIYMPQAPVPVGQKPQAPVKPKSDGKVKFDDVLKKKLEEADGLKFSAHAQKRLSSRGISLSEGDLKNINGAVSLAAQKGARESLVLMNDLAFVISVKNRTVITAVNGESIKENVFTNIDSAVIV